MDNNEKKIEVNKEALNNHETRVPIPFRIAYRSKGRLLDRAIQTGQTVAGIVEVAVNEYLDRDGLTVPKVNAVVERGEMDIFQQLEPLNPETIFKLIDIYLRTKKIEASENLSFKALRELLVLMRGSTFADLLREFFVANKVPIPTLDELIRTTGAGYKRIMPFGQVWHIRIKEPELNEILLKIKRKA